MPHSLSRRQLIERVQALEKAQAELRRWDDALRQRETQFRELFHNLRSGAVVYRALDGGGDFEFVDANRAVGRIDRLDPQTLPGRRLTETFPGVGEFGLLEVLRRVLRSGTPEQMPLSHYRDDRISGWRENYVYRLPNLDLVVIYDDVTARVQADAALRHERALLAAITGATDVMLAYLDPQFDFVWVNPAYAAASRMSLEEMVGKNHFELYPHPENEAIFRRVRDSGEAVFYKDKPFDLQDQPERGVTYWDWSLIPVKAEDARVQGLVFSLRETTQYKLAELALENKTRELEALLDTIPAMVFLKDPVLRHMAVNRTLCETLGLEPDQILGKTNAQLLPPDFAEACDLSDRRAIAGGTTTTEVVEESFLNNIGERRWVSTSKRPFYDAEGHPAGLVGVSIDITEAKRSEAERIRRLERQRDTLVREVHHRIKNHLQGITCLLRNRLDQHPEITDVLEETITQIQTISQVYGLQGRRQGPGLSLSQVVGAVLRDRIGAFPVQCRLPEDAESLHLAENEAVPLSLVINELVTNAIKHLVELGRPLRVSLERRGEEAVVKVSGGPARLPRGLDLAGRRGLGTGLELIDSLLPASGAELNLCQQGDEVEATLVLRPPIIRLDAPDGQVIEEG